VDLKSTGPRGPWGFESLALRHSNQQVVDHDSTGVAALVVGLLTTIQRLDREHGYRLLDHLGNLFREHRLRRLEGDAAANSWLISQLQELDLPDRRRWRTLQDDVILIRRYDTLQQQLRPIFREHASDARRRLQRAARIVSAITGHLRLADQLPTNPKLAQFCQEILNVTGSLCQNCARTIGHYRLPTGTTRSSGIGQEPDLVTNGVRWCPIVPSI
jgi:hypothetical protein